MIYRNVVSFYANFNEINFLLLYAYLVEKNNYLDLRAKSVDFVENVAIESILYVFSISTEFYTFRRSSSGLGRATFAGQGVVGRGFTLQHTNACKISENLLFQVKEGNTCKGQLAISFFRRR